MTDPDPVIYDWCPLCEPNAELQGCWTTRLCWRHQDQEVSNGLSSVPMLSDGMAGWAENNAAWNNFLMRGTEEKRKKNAKLWKEKRPSRE